MICGLEEAADEDIHSQGSIHTSIKEKREKKPFFKAERIGKQHSYDISRPVKVVLDSLTALADLLRKVEGAQ